jgi:LXG domain of WXG superfamily/Pre-toxin TG
VSRQVAMREVNELYIAYSQFANETITQLTELQKSIESFQQLEGFTGQAAASAKAYMSEVHGAIIQSFMLVISDIQVTFMNMIQQFENSVDNNKKAIIHTDHFIDLKTSFRQHNHQFLDVHHDIHQTIQQVSDIVHLSKPNSTRIEEMYYTINTEISNRDLDVEAFDSMNRDKMNASSDLIQSIMNSMNEIKASISTPSGIRYALGDITTSSWGQRLGDTAAPVSKQLTEQLEEMKENAEIAKANAPEERNGFIDFLGEMFFVYDIKRLATGKDPTTGEELSAGEKGLAVASFIPISKFTKLGKLGKIGDEALDVGKVVDEEELLEKIGDVSKGTGDNGTYRYLKDYENNTYFTRSVEYNAGKEGTGFTYKVYQRGDIDWNMVRTKGAKKGRGLTNAEAANKYGLAPILDDAGNVATLHHSQQKGVGPLFEASTRYHNISNAKRAPLHPYKGKLNPFYPMDEPTRKAFQKVDSIDYWKTRGKEALGGN